MAAGLMVAVLGGCQEPSDDPSSNPPEQVVEDTEQPPVDPAVDADRDGHPVDVDCDDGDVTVYPGAPDVCGDDRVTDCDRTTDDGLVTIAGAGSYDDLQQALDAADAGAALLLCGGTYLGPFVAERPVSLASHQGRDATTLSGQATRSTLRLVGGSSITGLTLRDGNSGGRGGGILMTGSGDLTVSDCVVTHNQAEDDGGGIALSGGLATIVDSVISDNTAAVGGGISGTGVTVDLSGTVVEANRAESGAGVWLENAVLTGGSLVGNTGEQVGGSYEDENGSRGGGLFGTGDLTATGTDIDGNSALQGGGIYLELGLARLVDVRVHANANPMNAFGIGSGGGIQAYRVALELSGTTEVYENESLYGYGGGGIHARYGSLVGGLVRDNTAAGYGGGIVATDNPLDGVIVTGNAATNGGGIAVAFSSPEPLALTDTFVTDNVAELGGGLWVDAPSMVIGGAVLRNVGSGVALGASGTVSSVSADWGTGLDDNTPADVAAEGFEVSGYGPDATFDCAPGSCQPLP